MKNYYTILGIRNTAGQDEIKAAYRRLAKEFHPDKNQGNKNAEDKFKEIQEAYSVLSNPEKRRRYDLKLNYGSSYTQKKQQGYGQYTGNAYQYAQQQAQYRSQQRYHTPPPPREPVKPDRSENYLIFISVGVAVALLYLIITYNTNSRQPDYTTVTYSTTPAPHTQPKEEIIEDNGIHEFDSPYSNIFGEKVSDLNSRNSLTIHNPGPLEIVVCLVSNGKEETTIRNQYMSSASTFKMNNIPDGEYFLRVYYGQNWDKNLRMLDDKVQGGFTNSAIFTEIRSRENIFKMQQKQRGSRVSYSTFEVELANGQADEKVISAEEFFQ